jgi:uncharacterized membrane protein
VTSFTVWSYPTPFGADAAEMRLKRLREVGDITVHDVVTVVWPAEAKRPRVGHRAGRRRDVLSGAGWGTVLGAVLGGPVGGAAVGAAAGGARHRARGPVIDDDVVDKLRAQIGPGTSAMFVLSSGANLASVLEVLARDPDALLLHHESDTAVARDLLDGIAEDGTVPMPRTATPTSPNPGDLPHPTPS